MVSMTRSQISPRLSLWTIVLVCALCASTLVASAASLPVIPGAVGFGIETRAAYGGSVNPTIYEVTNLNDSGPGSFRACATASGPRVCIFEVSGTINLGSMVTIDNPYITIAGQTAPDPGITLRGAPLRIRTHDVLVQHIRIRVGDDDNGVNPNTRDGIIITSTTGNTTDNVIIDHVSVSWSIDELLSIPAHVGDVTISNSIFSEALRDSIHPQGNHSMGPLFEAREGRVAFVNNLLAHNQYRNTRVAIRDFYFANNLIYNWGGRATEIYNDAGITTDITLVGNVYLKGNNSGTARPILVQPPGAPPRYDVLEGTLVYVEDNWGPGYDEEDPWAMVTNNAGAFVKASTPPITLPGHTPMSHTQVEAYVLAHAGARPADRDAVDERIVDDVENGTGAIIDSPSDVGGWPNLAQNTRDLTPLLPANPHGDDDMDGYTNLEEWLHQFAAAVEGTGSPPSGGN